MDEMIHELKQINKRERVRFVGGVFGTILHLLPWILFIGVAYSLYNFKDDFILRLASETANQVGTMTTDTASGFVEQIQELLGQ